MLTFTLKILYQLKSYFIYLVLKRNYSHVERMFHYDLVLSCSADVRPLTDFKRYRVLSSNSNLAPHDRLTHTHDTCQHFLNFHSVMTRISGNVQATSEYFRRFSEDFRTSPKMFEVVSTTFEHFRSYFYATILACCDIVRTQSKH